ncbi:MAG: class I SAM-dependent methyltransferase [Cyanobacteria bacterium P01_H01_bin.15]
MNAAFRSPDIAFIATPEAGVQAFLEFAQVGADDLVYDLGCGDGRIVIAAAKQCGAQGVGIDIDPQRIAEAEQASKDAAVYDRVSFRQEDIFACNFSSATVVFLYLLPHLNERLLPQLRTQLKPGARIVSRDFEIGTWAPEAHLFVPGEEAHTHYRWRI